MTTAEKLAGGLMGGLFQAAPRKGPQPQADGERFGALVQRAQPAQAGAPAVTPPAAISADEPGQMEGLERLVVQLSDLQAAAAPVIAELAGQAPGQATPQLGQVLSDIAGELGRLLEEFDAETGGNALETLRANIAALTSGGRETLSALIEKLEHLGDGADPAASLFALVRDLLGLPAGGQTETPQRVMTNPAFAAHGAAKVQVPVAGPTTPASEVVQAAGETGLPASPAQPRQARDVMGGDLRPWMGGAGATAQEAEDGALPKADLLPAQASAEGRQNAARPSVSALFAPEGVRLFLERVAEGAPADGGEAPAAPDLAVTLSTPRGHSEAAALRQPEAPAQTQHHSGFARGIQDQIRKAAFAEGHTRIELSPRGLGDIEIDIQTEETGRLRVVLRAENPAVLNALRADRDTLLSLLGDRGVAVDDAAFELGGFDNRDMAGRGQSNAPEGARGGLSGNDDEDEELAPTALRSSNWQNTISGGRLDIIT